MMLGDRPSEQEPRAGGGGSPPLYFLSSWWPWEMSILPQCLESEGLLALKEVMVFGGVTVVLGGGIRTEETSGCLLGERAGLAGGGSGPCC